jgi:hypothetical protein
MKRVHRKLLVRKFQGWTFSERHEQDCPGARWIFLRYFHTRDITWEQNRAHYCDREVETRLKKKKLFGNPGGPPEATAPSVIDGLMSFGGGKAAVQRRGILFFFSFPPLPPSPPNRFTPASSPQHRSTKTRSIHYATRSSEKFSVLYSKDAWGLLEFDRTVGGRELKVKD